MTETTPDLLSLVLMLKPLEVPPTAGSRSWWGYAAYHALLSRLQSWDAALAQELHDDQNPMPLTTSTLIGRFKNSLPDSSQTYQLRLTAYSPQTVSFLLAAAQPGSSLSPGSHLELDHLPFQVTAVLTTPTESGWARAETYQQLGNSTYMGSSPARSVTLQFSSPTVFKTGGQLLPFPLPRLVFGHLLEKWNRFAPVTLPIELQRYAEECLQVSRFELHSRTAVLPHSGKRPGAVGVVRYGTSNYDRYWMSLIQALAAFGFYAGVGKHTSMGLGQTRVSAFTKRKPD